MSKDVSMQPVDRDVAIKFIKKQIADLESQISYHKAHLAWLIETKQVK